MTFDLFATPAPDTSTSELIRLPGAELLFMLALFPPTEADALLDELNRNIVWQQETIQLYGQTHNLPRLTAWYGDAGRRYTYSGITVNATPWNSTLLAIKQRIEEHTDGVIFNSVVARPLIPDDFTFNSGR